MIRVLIAHPSRLVCDSLRTALDKVNDLHVVGTAHTPEELNFSLPHSTLTLLGSEIKGATTLNLLEEIRCNHPQNKVLILGVSDVPEDIIRYIEAGAAGYILEAESVDDMVEKMQAAHQQKALISPEITAVMMERLSLLANMDTPFAYNKARGQQLEELTPREEEVVELIKIGCTNKEIAEELFIEYGTVKNHVHNILKKLEVKSRHEAATLFEMQQQPALAMA